MSIVASEQINVLFSQLNTAESLSWRLQWRWEFPLWFTALIIAFSIAWVMALYFREKSNSGASVRLLLGLLRLTGLMLALLMLAQPAVERFRQERPRLVLLVDGSASMETLDYYADAKAELPRHKVWKGALTRGDNTVVEQLARDFQLEVIAFDDKVVHLNDSDTSHLRQLKDLELQGSPNGGTRLGDAIDYALRDLPGTAPAAILVVSDGISNRGQALPEAAQKARQLRVPLYTLAVGSDRVRPDIALEDMLVEQIVFPGDRLQVEAAVRATGLEGKEVEVTLLETAAGQTLGRTTLRLPADGVVQSVRFAVLPEQPGRLELQMAVEPTSEETNHGNNSVSQVVEVRDEKIRVLLVQSQPSYEYRALKSLLERDPAVDLRVLLQEADADYAAIDDAALPDFPTTEQELFAYDVLLLGDVDVGLLPRAVWPLVGRFVTEHGGGMVAIAGPRFMPHAFRGLRSFETLLPIKLDSVNPLRSQTEGAESFAITPTAEGRKTSSLQLGESTSESSRVWQSLPSISWLLRVEEVKPGAQVLVETLELRNRQGRPLPAILRHYVGAGEVLFHATDETWRWRWRSDDRYFARYWGQIVRRLGRGLLADGRQGIVLSADRALYEPGEPVGLHVRFRDPTKAPAADDQVVVQLRGVTGPPREAILQRRLGHRAIFATSVEDLPAGDYEALLVRPDTGGPTHLTKFEIRQPPGELAELRANLKGLKQAADITGGEFYVLPDIRSLASDLPVPLDSPAHEQPPRKLWNHPAVVALFVAVLSSEWVIRRRHGML